MIGGQRDWLLQSEARKATAVQETLGRFSHYFRPFSPILICVAALVIVGTYLQVSIPNLMGQAVDCYLSPVAAAPDVASASAAHCWYTTLGGADTPQASPAEYAAGLGGLVALIVGMFALSALLTGLQFFLMTYAGQKVLRALRVEVFAHIHRLSLGYYSKHEAGDVMSRITNDADTIQQAISFPLISVIQGSLLIVWIAYNMLRDSFALAIVALAVTPVMFVATSWFSGQARKAFRQVRSRVGDVNASLQENLSSVREAQAFNREDQNIQTFSESNAHSPP